VGFDAVGEVESGRVPAVAVEAGFHDFGRRDSRGGEASLESADAVF
jgi:hypothetical protein